MRLSLGTLLISLFGAILLVVVVQGYFATNSMMAIEAGSRQIIETRVPSFVIMGQINADTSDVRISQAGYLSAPDQFKSVFLQKVKDAEASLAAHRKTYEPLIVDKEDRELYETFAKDWATYSDLWNATKAMADGGEQDKAMALFWGDASKVYDKAGDDIQKGVDDLAGNVKHEGQANIVQINDASNVLLVALVVAIVVAASAAVISNRRIIKPIRAMTGNMRDLAGGDTTFTVPYQDRKDEIGGMSAALQVFKDNAVRARALEAEATAAREKAESEKARMQQEAEAAAALKLQQATAGLAVGLKRLAAGDLGFELTEPFAQEFEPLRHDLNSAVAQLGDTIGTVAQSAVAIGAGSREVSHSADDLSKRTEQQAASLEETAAALDEITVNVTNSAKRVQEARSVAREANGSAVQSGKVVAEAIEAMQRIEQSSNQISNIIGVIDEIAFQTNLLALNAGVEAARAGEAGRGFAVVATEVRELAQRSAKAAREIKGLITNSAEEVGNGVTHVRETGNVLKEIEEHIMTINGLMDAIATSAQEQSVGLSEVNTAVNQMDQVTQQNAAMVEETSAASANLASESARLQQLVAGFTLRQSGGSVGRRAA